MELTRFDLKSRRAGGPILAQLDNWENREGIAKIGYETLKREEEVESRER